MSLDPQRVAAAVAGTRWRAVRHVASTGSTNADLAEGLRTGAAEPGDVLVADLQTAGRGRLGRGWTSPPGVGLTVSVAVEPAGVPVVRWPWLPLVTGLALADAVDLATAGRVRPGLKWPNDVQVGGRKLAGVLLERAGSAVVLGSGTNVSTAAADLPPGATSLHAEGSAVTRTDLLVALLHALDRLLARWERASGDAQRAGLRAAYADRCLTLGRDVRVELPGGLVHEGRAEAVDASGRLVVAGRAVGAGDVVHLR